MKKRFDRISMSLIPLGLILGLAACDSAGQPATTPGTQVSNQNPTGTSPAPSGGFPSCVSSDPSHICIGLKVVSYKDSTGKPALAQDAAVALVQGMNQIWQTCNVAYQIESYEAVDPTAYGLDYGANSENQLTQIRQQFANDSTFLVVASGPWNTSSIAWTEMPGAAPYGTIVDSDYATDPITVGHELGHYQGLDHVSTSGNLMYPIVYPNDNNIDSSQCASAVSTDQSYWQKMMRH